MTQNKTTLAVEESDQNKKPGKVAGKRDTKTVQHTHWGQRTFRVGKSPMFCCMFPIEKRSDFAAGYVRLPEGTHVFVVPSKLEVLEPGGTLFLLVPVEQSDCRFALKGRFQHVDIRFNLSVYSSSIHLMTVFVLLEQPCNKFDSPIKVL